MEGKKKFIIEQYQSSNCSKQENKNRKGASKKPSFDGPMKCILELFGSLRNHKICYLAKALQQSWLSFIKYLRIIKVPHQISPNTKISFTATFVRLQGKNCSLADQVYLKPKSAKMTLLLFLPCNLKLHFMMKLEVKSFFKQENIFKSD